MTDHAVENASVPLRWGVSLLPDLPVAQVAKLGAFAEEMGFDRCWVFDEGLATRELYVTLTALALCTERIELGPGITNPYTRHPSVAASAIASLHELSGGRAFLGLGVGGSLTLDPIGLPRDRPHQTLKEAIHTTRALFAAERSTYEGEVFQLHQAYLEFADPSIPIWVAGRGQRVLTSASQLADGVSLDHIHRDFLGDQVALIRSASADAGNQIELAYSSTLVITDADLERVRRHMTYRLADSPPAVKEAIGLSEADAYALREAMVDGLDVAARLVRDEWVLPFVIHGSSAECAARILEISDTHGLVEFTVPVPDLAVAHETISAAAEIAALIVSRTASTDARSRPSRCDS